jgi:phage terminase large subunit-like protein
VGRADLAILPHDTDLVEWLLTLEPGERERAIDLMGPVERESFDRDWASWAHDGQGFPRADWATWVIMAGRGFGKTLAGSQWITAAVAGDSLGDSLSGCPHPGAGRGQSDRLSPLSIALVGATLDEARRVMVEGRSGLIAVADAWVRDWNPSLRRLTFTTGAQAVLFSGASPEQLRGPEHHLAWCDELAKWEKPQETWDMLQLGLRLSERPRAIVTTTPRPGPVLKSIMAEPDTIVTGGPTCANPHTSPAWKRAVESRYAGTRLGRQELDGELLTDAPGALWTVELLERCRSGDSHFHARNGTLRHGGAESDCPHFTRIVIAVDPPSGDGTCGIIACAKDAAGIAHVLADHSVTNRTPEGWSRAVADAVLVHSLQSSPGFPGEGDHPEGGGGAFFPIHVVAEQNQGGKMVAAVLHTADPNLHVKPVTATVGKAERAAPVAMLFEAGKVVLHGRFPELEAELLGMIAGGEYEGPGVSPDRADAMVWGLTELMLGKESIPPRVRQL